MSEIEIDLTDANALAGTAVEMVAGQTYQEHRAAVLLIAAVWLLMHEDGLTVTQEDVDRAVKQCVRDHVCPCKVSLPGAGGALHDLTDLSPAWVTALRALRAAQTAV